MFGRPLKTRQSIVADTVRKGRILKKIEVDLNDYLGIERSVNTDLGGLSDLGLDTGLNKLTANSDNLSFLDSQEIRLTTDGPNEQICRMLTVFSGENETSNLMLRQQNLVKEEEERKRNFVQSFVDKYTKVFKITRDQLKKLVNTLETEGILALDNQLSRILHKKALLTNIFWSGCIVTFLTSTLWFFLSGGVVPSLSFFLSFYMFATTMGWLFPFMTLSENFYSERSNIYVPYRPADHMALRRYLKKKYGSSFFPYSELRRELGLELSEGIRPDALRVQLPKPEKA